MNQQNSCNGNPNIVGCRFSLYPMADSFVDVIKTALASVDTSNVWMETDDVSTCIRGTEAHVFSTLEALLAAASKDGVHIALNANFSAGCPGDSEGDVYLDAEPPKELPVSLKELSSSTYVGSQFALYPMGTADYMDIIYEACKTATEIGTFSKGVHYASRLDGSIDKVIETLATVFKQTRTRSSHVVMTWQASVHSPSHKKENE
ncbi:YkoF family thiamine/hydroxymethylpyrimidine-binding protein [Bacillus fonticola]|uniref:YkoF family thiamine/hydroxymethylpyrimidine-binding protein n=1 Tax=Bacillus fonticola TaxID=2728853 RepID=UPI001475AC2B|nr:YkoF family thiamine/hydroxymethylpyrimidine-binding protein [Bacillus fonticola]